MSLALALSAMLLPVHAPLAGLVIFTVGGVESLAAATVTEMLELTVRPAPSVTIRPRTWAPAVTPLVFHA